MTETGTNLATYQPCSVIIHPTSNQLIFWRALYLLILPSQKYKVYTEMQVRPILLCVGCPRKYNPQVTGILQMPKNSFWTRKPKPEQTKHMLHRSVSKSRAFISMDPLVSDKVRALSEASSTFQTFIRFFPSVSSPVFNEGCTLTEAFPTERTSIRLLPCVDSLVLKEVRALFETLLTFLTFIASLPITESLRPKEAEIMAGLLTFLTFTVFLSSMGSLMPI